MSKSLWGYFKDYAKENPVKTLLIGSAIVVGIAAVGVGIAATAGLAIPVIGGGIVGAGVVAAHYGLLTGISSTAAAPVIGGVVLTAIGIAAAGMAAIKQRSKSSRARVQSALNTANIQHQMESHPLPHPSTPTSSPAPAAKQELTSKESQAKKRVRFADDVVDTIEMNKIRNPTPPPLPTAPKEKEKEEEGEGEQPHHPSPHS